MNVLTAAKENVDGLLSPSVVSDLIILGTNSAACAFSSARKFQSDSYINNIECDEYIYGIKITVNLIKHQKVF